MRDGSHTSLVSGGSVLESRVIVVGAGIIGLGIALELIWRGADVTAGINADLITSGSGERAIEQFRVDRF